MVKLNAPSAVVCKELLGDMVLISLSPVNSERPKEKQYRSEEDTSELQLPCNLVCRLLLEKKSRTLGAHGEVWRPGQSEHQSQDPARYPVLAFFNDTATTEIYTLSLHDALPISLNTRTSAIRGPPASETMSKPSIVSLPFSRMSNARLFSPPPVSNPGPQ